MAHVRKLPSGKWNAVVRHPSGRRISKTDPLKRVVVAWAQQAETEIRNGNVAGDLGRRTSVRAWHDKWVTMRNVEATTSTKEASRLRRHILPQWGPWPIGAVQRSDVQAWVTRLAKSGLAGETVIGIYRTFSKMMTDAELEGLIPVTPCRKIEMPRKTKPAPRWLTVHEYDRLQLAMLGDLDRPDPHGRVWQALIGVACFTGLRPGELGGLDVGDIDFDRRLIRVEQVMTPHGLRAYPKTDSSRRTVPFPDEVADLLWPVVADKGDNEAAFTMPEGGRLHHSNWTGRVWTPALRRARIKHVRAYVTRHTAASWMVQAGMPEAEIAEILGHAGRDLVATYAHLQPGAHASVRAAWELVANERHTGSEPQGVRAGQGGVRADLA